MKFIRTFSPTLIATLALILAFSAISFGKTSNSSFPSVKIDNFGQMDARFYRGARPSSEDLEKSRGPRN